MLGRPSGFSHRGIPAGTAEAIRRTRLAIPDRQRHVLRNRIADKRAGLHDAARRTSSHSTVESHRRVVGVASITGDADDARCLSDDRIGLSIRAVGDHLVYASGT